MENNKTDKKSETGEKFTWCKYHYLFIPLVAVILSISVFGIGMAIGHEFGYGGGFEEVSRWQAGGCFGQSFFSGERFSNEKMNNFIPGKETKEQANIENKTEVEDSTSTSQNLNATSTVSQ